MEPPPGSLRKGDRTRDGELGRIPTPGLVAELLARLRGGEEIEAEETAAEPYAILAMELEAAIDMPHNRFSRRHISDLFHLTRFPGSDGCAIDGATFVELGCGSVNPLAGLFTLVMLGARRGIGIDLDPVQDHRDAARGLARCASYLLGDPRFVVGDYRIDRQTIAANIEGFDFAKLWSGDPEGIDGSRLELRRESVHRMSLADGEADVVYSKSFLEHVPEIERALAEIARITRPGGHGTHTIDGIDHAHYHDPSIHPLEFLTIDSTAALVGDSNRIRPLHYPALFEAAGFEVLACEEHRRVAVDDALVERLAEPFRSMPREWLEVVGVAVRVRRRG